MKVSKKRFFWLAIRPLVSVGGLGMLTGFIRKWMGYEISSEVITDSLLAGLFLQIMYMIFGLVIANVFRFPSRSPKVVAKVRHIVQKPEWN